MADATASRDGELVLAPGTYAYVLDKTKGKVSVVVGPYKSSLSNTDQLVVWDVATQRYRDVQNTDGSQPSFAVAEQGQYIVLTNPAPNLGRPPTGQASDAVELEVGRRVIVQGPAAFPLWPGQSSQTIDGHHLRHNQYVIVRVYDAELAQENVQQAVMSPQVPVGKTDGDSGSTDASEPPVAPPVLSETTFTMGQLIVVPGTGVSFYMPSTGMEVVPESEPTVANARRLQRTETDPGSYVRNAVTLETLQYCILLDENGQKRYVRGPAVVFPSPTETFKVNENGSRVFDAIELNAQSGLYVKVIEAYTEDFINHPVGEELFITGKEQAIYFPRAEHSIITYDGKRKSHAIAVPAGEGRYVLNRTKGSVDLVTGPTMLLPDPRTEVIVRRVLDPHDVETMYPGNAEALAVNARYASERQTTAAEYLENFEMTRGAVASYASADVASSRNLATNSPGQHFQGDQLQRGTSYTPPRTITLDTKYEGAVAISIYPGYAVLITDKIGNRRVEVGPKVVLLDYDETIMTLSLSTGRPKNDTNLLRTGYLRIINNVVTDRIDVETRDLVEMSIEVSYRVNFEGDDDGERERWFDVENYVQVLTDHGRSRLRNRAKRAEVLDFYTNAIDIVRDTLLGPAPAEGDRPGLAFEENGMRVYDVEVLNVTIESSDVEELLSGAQSAALHGAIELAAAEEHTVRSARAQELVRTQLAQQQETVTAQQAIAIMQAEQEFQLKLERVAGELQVRGERLKLEERDREGVKLDAEQGLALQIGRDEAELHKLHAETAEMVLRVAAISPELIAAMQAFSNGALVEKIVLAIGPAALAAGVSTVDMLDQLFKGTPFGSVFDTLAQRPLAVGNSQK